MTPPMIFIPGLFETPDIWAPTQARLGLSAARCLNLPLPGHDPARRALTVAEWTNDASARIADFAGGEPAMIVSHSTGAMLSLLLAQQNPAAIDSIVMAGGLTCGHRGRAACFSTEVMKWPKVARPLFGVLWRYWLSNRARFEQGLRSVTTPAVAAEFSEQMRSSLQACRAEDIRLLADWVLRHSLIDVLENISTPVLAVIGSADAVVPARHQLNILRGVSHAQGYLMDAGHLPFLENPRAFDSALLGWMTMRQAARPFSAAA